MRAEREKNIYNSQNIITLLALFAAALWLLYSLTAFWYNNQKINDEIEAIRMENESNMEKIEEKKRRLEYLQTQQRIDKEAKMQMNRKQEGEKVLILIEEKMDIIPTATADRTAEDIQKESVPTLDKWKWIFFGQR